MTRRREILLDFFLLFASASIFLAPYYTHKYTDQWPSIESTFIADARFLADHLPHPRWQPLWYTGTRFDYIYPPAIRYGTAMLSKIFGWWTVKAYHFYTMFFYCLGIAGVYLLVRTGGRSRAAGILCAVATGLMSPTLIFMKNMRLDSGPWVPVRFTALIRYGEGPHITALCLLPIALAFTWRALEANRPRAIALAGIFCAAVVSNNFYGATSLAIFFPLLLWSFWVTRREKRAVLTALVIPLLAYGLTAFWLSPSYLRITLHNMQYVSEKGNPIWALVGAATLVIYGLVSNRFAARRAHRTWAVFIGGAVTLFTLNVLGNYYFNFRVLGEPGRLIPELDLVWILGAGLLLERLWRVRGAWPKVAAAIVIVLALATTYRYVKIARHIVVRWPDYQSRVEYRVTDWIAKNKPDARVMTSGSLRFWFNTWHDLTEVGGGSEQGLLNPIVYDATWEIDGGDHPEPVQLWLKALGADIMYAPGPKSEDPYKDIQHLERFADLPLLWDDGLDNRLWSTNRRWPARARVVNQAAIKSIPAPRNSVDVETLRVYVQAIENGPDSPVEVQRPSTDEMLLHAKVDAGQSLLVQETWDPAWRATANGTALAIRKDAMGFMVVDPPAGDQAVRFEFTMPWENRVGWGFTVLTLLAIAGLARRRGV